MRVYADRSAGEWLYIGIDGTPPVGEKLQLLNPDGVAMHPSTWSKASRAIAWLPMPKENKAKREQQKLLDAETKARLGLK